ncbi:MAG: DNA polymerase Y family protein, partial [Sphingomonas sp.]
MRRYQTKLFDPHAGVDSLDPELQQSQQVRDLARLVDVVAGRIGAQSVFRIAPVESHVPERAVT